MRGEITIIMHTILFADAADHQWLPFETWWIYSSVMKKQSVAHTWWPIYKWKWSCFMSCRDVWPASVLTGLSCILLTSLRERPDFLVICLTAWQSVGVWQIVSWYTYHSVLQNWLFAHMCSCTAWFSSTNSPSFVHKCSTQQAIASIDNQIPYKSHRSVINTRCVLIKSYLWAVFKVILTVTNDQFELAASLYMISFGKTNVHQFSGHLQPLDVTEQTNWPAHICHLPKR